MNKKNKSRGGGGGGGGVDRGIRGGGGMSSASGGGRGSSSHGGGGSKDSAHPGIRNANRQMSNSPSRGNNDFPIKETKMLSGILFRLLGK